MWLATLNKNCGDNCRTIGFCVSCSALWSPLTDGNSPRFPKTTDNRQGCARRTWNSLVWGSAQHWSCECGMVDMTMFWISASYCGLLWGAADAMDLTSTEPSPAPSDSTPSGWGQVDWEDEGSLQCLRRGKWMPEPDRYPLDYGRSWHVYSM